MADPKKGTGKKPKGSGRRLYTDENPKGGLTAKGRAFFKKKEGANLKPPVKRGVNPRRISFAARFAGMKGKEKDEKGKPTRLGLALKAWGFRSKESARNFANRHKKKKS